jgi:MFS family permease
VFAVVLAANIMDLMDATIVNGAGPSIRAALGAGPATLQWLPAGYTLAFAVFLMTGARLGDMLGRRRLFLIGSGGFTLMSAAGSSSPRCSPYRCLRAGQSPRPAREQPASNGYATCRKVRSGD